MKKLYRKKRCEVAKCLQITEKEAEYFVFTGEAITQLMILVMKE